MIGVKQRSGQKESVPPPKDYAGYHLKARVPRLIHRVTSQFRDLTILYVKEVVTHSYYIVSYCIKWVLPSWTYSSSYVTPT